MNAMLAVMLALTGAAADVALAGPSGLAVTNAVEAGEVVTTRVTARRAYYDRKEGYACFRGRVLVDDPEYLLHADQAYVFLEGASNVLDRIVAIGRVAVTNGTRRAYGARASYYRQPGMLVLCASDTTPAEVRDEARGGDQVVRGKKIKFWTASQQVEVTEAWITAPREATSGKTLKDAFGG